MLLTHEPAAGEWTEALAGEYLAGLDPAARGLPRPVAANNPLQSYFVDPGFAAAARSRMFDERMLHQLADGGGRP